MESSNTMQAVRHCGESRHHAVLTLTSALMQRHSTAKSGYKICILKLIPFTLDQYLVLVHFLLNAS